MDKYLEAIGVWEHTIGKITHVFEPNMYDNSIMKRIMAEFQRTKNYEMLLTKTCDYYFSLVQRAYPELSEDDAVSLRKWIDMNQTQIVEDVQISHGWLKQDDIDALKKQMGHGDALKNLM